MSDESSAPVIARVKPFYHELEEGTAYLWCACGRSQNQPFCDGSHKGTGFRPVRYVAGAAEEVLFCGCKRTCQPPFCDGSHNNVPGAYREDDPDSVANRAIPLVDMGPDGRAMLDGGCYVFSVARAPLDVREGMRYATIISPAHGARYQSQFFCEVDAGASSPLMAFGDRHVILFVTGGPGVVAISGRELSVEPSTGLYVRPGEAFRFTSTAPRPMQAFVSACPAAEQPAWPEVVPGGFDESCPRRLVGIDQERRRKMAVRFFQMLVDRTIGSTVVTQFIGEIPLSKAEPHRHLYEEALIILSGHGCMWTETRRARVTAGDVIFLPRKQAHSLQCTDPAGMEVVGVIFPGDNPSISY